MKTLGCIVFRFKKVSLGIIAIAAFSNTTMAQGNNVKKILLANLEISKPTNVKYVTKEANIVFPTVLQGNEEQSIAYIEKFATAMRQKSFDKWGNKFIAFRSAMQVVN